MLALENIDYTLAYYLEKAVTDAGYFPDRDSFLPNDAAGFDAAILAVVADKGFIVEVFSTANYTSRSDIKSCNIIVERGAISPSRANFSRGQTVFTEIPLDLYRKSTLPDTVYDIDYQIRVISDFVGTERAVTGIILAAFGMGNYFEPIGISAGERVVLADEQAVFIAPSGGTADLSGTGYIEKVHSYQVKHAGITPERNVTEIPAIIEINIELNPIN